MTQSSQTFGISIPEVFKRGVRGYLANALPLSLAAAVTLGTVMAFRFPAQAAFDDGEIALSIALDLMGLVLAATVALPWYFYALDVADGRDVDMGRPLRDTGRFWAQAVASFWFWAGFLLGLRYLYGIPSLLALVFYAFYGYAVADSDARGLIALGTSVRIGTGKRIGVAALAALFLLFNLLGALALGYAVNALTIAVTIVGLMITTSITMVSGAHVYRVLLKAADG